MRTLSYGAALVWAAVGVSAIAQTSTPATYQTAVTTAMVGLAASQTAQLNALNVSIPTNPAGNTAVACPVQLEFYDSANRSLKSATINNLAPGNAASLSLTFSDFPTGTPVSILHTLMRGVVRSNLAAATPVMPMIGILPPIAVSVGCSVFVSLQVFDTATGVSQALTTDTRYLQSFILPLGAR